MEFAVELVRKQDVLNLCEFYMNHYYSLSRVGIIEKLRVDVHNLAVAQKICDKCGRICFEKENFCPACGANLRKEPVNEP
jgi:uncharacterized OB-fold protein